MYTEHARKSQRGFTLIELLVVIAIIGMLSSVVLASLNGARQKARNARRAADMKQLQAALELYYSDNNAYPIGGWFSSEPGDAWPNNSGNYIPGLAPTHISVLPRDPKGGVSAVCGSPNYSAYLYYSDGQNYKLLSQCAPEGTWSSSSGLYDPVRPTYSWMVCSGEPACTTW